jgi:hypothetical protein
VTAPPTVTLTSVPGDGPSTQATFAWAVTGFGTISWCTLDAAPETPCASPRTWRGLSAGRHTLRIDARSRIGSASVSHSWTITSGSGSGSGGGQNGSPPPPPAGGRPLDPPPASELDVHALSAARFTLSPSRVRAGGFVTARVTISTDNGLAVASRGQVACTAKAGRRAANLAYRKVAALTRSIALVTCRWNVPKRLRGRTLKMTIALRVGTLRASRVVSRRVR